MGPQKGPKMVHFRTPHSTISNVPFQLHHFGDPLRSGDPLKMTPLTPSALMMGSMLLVAMHTLVAAYAFYIAGTIYVGHGVRCMLHTRVSGI